MKCRRRYVVRFVARLASTGELIEACEMRLFARSYKSATTTAARLVPDLPGMRLFDVQREEVALCVPRRISQAGALVMAPSSARVTRRSAERAGWRIDYRRGGLFAVATHEQRGERIASFTLAYVLQEIGRRDRSAFAPVRRRTCVAAQTETYKATTTADERRDCAVRATAIAACEDYKVTHERYTRHGRSDRSGTPLLVIAAVMRELGAAVVKLPCTCEGFPRPLTLACFVTMYPAGHYVCVTTDHAFAVVDGVTHDYAPRPRCRVTNAWRLDA